MSASERGNAALELTLGVAVLLVPVAMVIGLLPAWLERQSVAALAAREAARAFVLAADAGEAAASSGAVARRIAGNHGIDPADFSISVSGALARGATATATARVRVPLTSIPGLGWLGGFTLTAEHTEVVDPYRSW